MTSTLVVYHGKEFTKYPGLYQTITLNLVDGLLHVYDRNIETGDQVLMAIFRDWQRIEVENS